MIYLLSASECGGSSPVWETRQRHRNTSSDEDVRVAMPTANVVIRMCRWYSSSRRNTGEMVCIPGPGDWWYVLYQMVAMETDFVLFTVELLYSHPCYENLTRFQLIILTFQYYR